MNHSHVITTNKQIMMYLPTLPTMFSNPVITWRGHAHAQSIKWTRTVVMSKERKCSWKVDHNQNLKKTPCTDPKLHCNLVCGKFRKKIWPKSVRDSETKETLLLKNTQEYLLPRRGRRDWAWRAWGRLNGNLFASQRGVSFLDWSRHMQRSIRVILPDYVLGFWGSRGRIWVLGVGRDNSTSNKILSKYHQKSVSRFIINLDKDSEKQLEKIYGLKRDKKVIQT